MVVANLGPDGFPEYVLPWPWTHPSTERGARPGAPPLRAPGNGSATVSLQPFEVRVFEVH